MLPLTPTAAAPANHATADPVRAVLDAMTLEEKAGMLAGTDDWHFRGVPRLGVPSIRVTDCGHGVTLCGDRSSPATCFPTGIGMASTWNETLMRRVGEALGRETRALGCSMMLGPMINLHRVPLNGRSFETFSEDPVLAGRLGAAIIRGIQSVGVAACVKSVTANNQQRDQEKNSSEVDERTLRELYLRAFEIAHDLGRPAAIMTSYNRLNGRTTAESPWLLTEVIKGEWGFDGLIVSDWRAVRSPAALTSGLDVEMPGPGKWLNTQAVLRAVADGTLTAAQLDEKVARILGVLLTYGRDETDTAGGALDTPEHRTLAREVAEESIVLLKNDGGLLPLDRREIRKLLVVGPNASEARIGGGGSASVTPFYSVSPLAGLRELLGDAVEVQFLEGCSIVGTMEPVRSGLEHLNGDGGWHGGLRAEFFNDGDTAGTPDAAWVVPDVNCSWGWAAPGPGVRRTNYAVRFSGRLVPRATGVHKFGVFAQEGCVRFRTGGDWLVNEWPGEASFEDDYSSRYRVVEVELTAGVPVEITLEYAKRAARGAARLEWQEPGAPDPLIRVAEAAKWADAVVVCAGLSNLLEGGSRDRADMDLPASQQKLIETCAAANPRTVVVLNNGGPLAMPWADRVPAVLEAWYPGQEGGRAIARMLFGDVNPSGRLPDTLARRFEDHASSRNYPGDGTRVVYEEGLHVGYRHFDAAGVEPHFPFGFGLSYTTFRVERPQLHARDGAARISARVTNTGARPGQCVVQFYVGAPSGGAVPRPPKELRGFRKVMLEPGASAEVAYEPSPRDFAHYEVGQGWRVEPGEYQLLVGEHSRSLAGVAVRVDADGRVDAA